MLSKLNISNILQNDRILTEKNYVPNKIESSRIFPSCPEEEIVISGMAGRYPNCDNTEEFRHHLYNKVCIFHTLFSWHLSSLNQTTNYTE